VRDLKCLQEWRRAFEGAVGDMLKGLRARIKAQSMHKMDDGGMMGVDVK
jgi:hypothetical protein